jgi:hypothetical protein
MDYFNYLVSNREGTCIRQEGVDAIWPDDDRAPLTVDGKTPFKLPPTCAENVQTFEEQVGYDTLLAFIDGEPLPPPAIPLPSSAVLLVTALVVIFIFIRNYPNRGEQK